MLASFKKDIADRLGLARTAAVKLLDEALKRAEVQIWIAEGESELVDLGIQLEFTWRLSSPLGAECFLFPAPLLVDSADTKERLLTRCGLDRLESIAATLDLAVVSVGDIGASATSLSRSLIWAEELRELAEGGCGCDMMCNFLDAEGRSVDHPLYERVMSIGLDTIARARHIVLRTGGRDRTAAILAARTRIRCNTLVTDEQAARRLLELSA
ncbi:hypothetical protein C3941_05310 [Kaistia algarum]|uniref:sugar-binding domain-containing protein n=1 Tax=Kaistia algarum TaxID=2083279 RepID=UPI000CE75B0B|nr:sugar-binding domain-containing protein [Kaistia algarum]MCX5515902.1 hypothetical protein [Kaistia algarum]PPE80734.1 hypothetical protein C3941_05310 [Kaistia algarum]